MATTIYPLKLYIRHRRVAMFFIIGLILNVATAFWLFWNIRPQEDPIYLHYNILFGVDFIGPWWRIVFLPLTGFVILLFNAVLGWLMFHRDQFIAMMLGVVSIMCQIFLLIGSTLLVFLNV